MSLPTIVFIPGLCQTPEHFGPFMKRLNDSGYPTKCMKLPSVDSEDPLDQSIGRDADFIRREVLMPELDDEKDVVLVMHSYGSVPSSAAARGLSLEERYAQGLKGGIVGLIYISALILSESESPYNQMKEFIPEPFMPLYNEDTFQIEPTDEMAEIFFHNTEDKELFQMATNALRPQSICALKTSSPAPAWGDSVFQGRRAYLITKNDRAIPELFQKFNVLGSWKHWRKIHTLVTSDHTPFLSQQEELQDFIEALALVWV